ncbi:hypothetical protein F5Y12DRAFT_715063 [Xylaria sp. FL1777]|nr:hypothetical protein F5Y12DRAFT_715063 [Xylaria sp. FL1777]
MARASSPNAHSLTAFRDWIGLASAIDVESDLRPCRVSPSRTFTHTRIHAYTHICKHMFMIRWTLIMTLIIQSLLETLTTIMAIPGLSPPRRRLGQVRAVMGKPGQTWAFKRQVGRGYT